ncbi:hypothetical protein CDAR_420881 [Caerostris darwini]|uniref:Uncharacterized protein n=1 Tax=Caerostris darwini TaxID=1538125 RepID=A0AAV4X4I0_9ARAC|nr:hypothetical protein CDAR_420881 [Caerostris darwini]
MDARCYIKGGKGRWKGHRKAALQRQKESSTEKGLRNGPSKISTDLDKNVIRPCGEERQLPSRKKGIRRILCLREMPRNFEFVQQTKAAKRKAFIFSSLSKNHMGRETNMLKAIRFENICKLLSRGNFWFLQRLKEGKSRVLVRLSDTGVRFAVSAYFQITRGG